VTRLTIDPADPQVVYVTFSGFDSAAGAGHVFRSGDGGGSWQRIDNLDPAGVAVLPDIPANAIEVDPAVADRLFVATDVGIFRTDDGGQQWEPFDQGLPSCIVSDLIWHPGDVLYAATFGRGVYRRTL
jgi:photosystem II stability/assembly factor-like uncharacterized protein